MIWSLIGSIGGKILDIVDDVVEDKDEANHSETARSLMEASPCPWPQGRAFNAKRPYINFLNYRPELGLALIVAMVCFLKRCRKIRIYVFYEILDVWCWVLI